MTRVLLFGLLAVVAMAAAVLSFSALRDLGLACGFDPRLAWLVPVVVDAGAAAGSVSWLSQPSRVARVFGRRLAMVLLAASVIGNGLAHLLEAYHLVAAWGLVVAVSALAPCVLGAVVHLVVLAVQDDVGSTDTLDAPERFPKPGSVEGSQVGQLADSNNLDRAGTGSGWELSPTPDLAGVHKIDDGQAPTDGQRPVDDRAADLIADGAGRRRLAKELGISEYEARQLMNERVNGNGAAS